MSDKIVKPCHIKNDFKNMILVSHSRGPIVISVWGDFSPNQEYVYVLSKENDDVILSGVSPRTAAQHLAAWSDRGCDITNFYVC
jgi:hypothetical protein